MEAVLVEVPVSPPLLTESTPASLPPVRDNLGRFPKGVSGNPAGRPEGSQNKASLIKQFIEERLSAKLEKDALAIMQKAINMAKDGDKSMIKLLLGDMMAATRSPHNEKSSGPVQVNVQIKNYTDPKSAAPAITIVPTEVS